MRGLPLLLLLAVLNGSPVSAQTLESARTDQIGRLQNYVLDAIQPSGLVRDSLVLSGNSFHPATPDAAGFALIALSAFDHLDTLPNAEQHVIDVLSAYAGETPGVNPVRSTDGHFLHFIDIVDGSDPPAGMIRSVRLDRLCWLPVRSLQARISPTIRRSLR